MRKPKGLYTNYTNLHEWGGGEEPREIYRRQQRKQRGTKNSGTEERALACFLRYLCCLLFNSFTKANIALKFVL